MIELDTAGATFSPCRTWRYDLTRIWARGPDPLLVNFLLLNPSTADETEDDPTIRRCMGFAREWGYDGCVITNIFGFRATDPKEMRAAPSPIGPENNKWILHHTRNCQVVVCAWGTHGSHHNRERMIIRMLQKQGIELLCLGKTKHGHPKHPLYLRADTELEGYP